MIAANLKRRNNDGRYCVDALEHVVLIKHEIGHNHEDNKDFGGKEKLLVDFPEGVCNLGTQRHEVVSYGWLDAGTKRDSSKDVGSEGHCPKNKEGEGTYFEEVCRPLHLVLESQDAVVHVKHAHL